MEALIDRYTLIMSYWLGASFFLSLLAVLIYFFSLKYVDTLQSGNDPKEFVLIAWIVISLIEIGLGLWFVEGRASYNHWPDAVVMASCFVVMLCGAFGIIMAYPCHHADGTSKCWFEHTLEQFGQPVNSLCWLCRDADKLH